MRKMTDFRAAVMKYAYQLWLVTGETWSVCLKKSWNLYRFMKRLKEGVIEFTYQKIDGSIRKAYGTLLFRNSVIPVNEMRNSKFSFKTITYFDIVKNAFRSFRIENLIGCY